MKRLALSAILAMGIHAYLLWADFGWMENKPSVTPIAKVITMELITRPMTEIAPAPKPANPSPPPAPALKPKPKPLPQPKAASRPKPKPVLEPVSSIKAAPLLPEEQKPLRFTHESEPVPESPPAKITAEEIPEAPSSLPDAESNPPTTFKADAHDLTDPNGPVEVFAAPAVIREAKPRYRENPPPPYPLLARKRGYQGTVVLDVFIDEKGRVADMKVFSSSGYAILDRAARTTVENWLFEPGLKGDEKISMWVKVPIRFHLK